MPFVARRNFYVEKKKKWVVENSKMHFFWCGCTVEVRQVRRRGAHGAYTDRTSICALVDITMAYQHASIFSLPDFIPILIGSSRLKDWVMPDLRQRPLKNSLKTSLAPWDVTLERRRL